MKAGGFEAAARRAALMRALVGGPRGQITRRQHDVLTTLVAFRNAAGFSPTLDDIGELLGINKVTVFGHLKQLEERGLVGSAGPGLSRSYFPMGLA